MIGLAVLTVVGWNGLAMGQNGDMEKKAAIEAVVDEYLNSCEIKKCLMTSDSEVLRRTAALAVMKKAYFQNYKEQLVEEMVAMGVEPKPYQVHYHLNAKFFEAIRPQAVAQK
jgi:hypothetical protein